MGGKSWDTDHSGEFGLCWEEGDGFHHIKRKEGQLQIRNVDLVTRSLLYSMNTYQALFGAVADDTVK